MFLFPIFALLLFFWKPNLQNINVQLIVKNFIQIYYVQLGSQNLLFSEASSKILKSLIKMCKRSPFLMMRILNLYGKKGSYFLKAHLFPLSFSEICLSSFVKCEKYSPGSNYHELLLKVIFFKMNSRNLWKMKDNYVYPHKLQNFLSVKFSN